MVDNPSSLTKDQKLVLKHTKTLLLDPTIQQLAKTMQENIVENAKKVVYRANGYQTYYDLAHIGEKHFLSRKNPMFTDDKKFKISMIQSFYRPPKQIEEYKELSEEVHDLKREIKRIDDTRYWNQNTAMIFKTKKKELDDKNLILEKIEKTIENLDFSKMSVKSFDSTDSHRIQKIHFGSDAYAYLSESGKEKWQSMYEKNFKTTYQQVVTSKWIADNLQQQYFNCKNTAEKCSMAILSLYAQHQANILLDQSSILNSIKNTQLDRDTYALSRTRDLLPYIKDKPDNQSLIQFDPKRKQQLMQSAEKVLDMIRRSVNRYDFEWESRWDESNKTNWNSVGCVADNYEVSGSSSDVRQHERDAEAEIKRLGLQNDLEVNFHHGDKSWYMFEICIK